MITDTHEQEYYELDLVAPVYDYELDNLMHTTPPDDLDQLRIDVTDGMGLSIVPNPRTVTWDLPMVKTGQPYPYTINFTALGGTGNLEWCLWNFDEPDGYDECIQANYDLDELGCLFEGTKPNGDTYEVEGEKVDCVCNSELYPCTCKCGLPGWLDWDYETATLTPDGNVTDTAGTCYYSDTYYLYTHK